MKTNFYQGFDGEPSVSFSCETENSIDSIKIWEGYFDDLMSFFQINTQGNWDGLALYYHLHTGWYEHSNWIIPNLKSVIDKFRKLSIPEKKTQVIEIRNTLVKFLELAYINKLDVRIDYE